MPAREVSKVDKEIGARIWRGRLSRGVSQQALADCLGLDTQQAVRLMEQGKIKASVARLLDIGTVLDLPLSYFLEGFLSGDRHALQRISPESIGIARAIDLTTEPEQRAQLLKIISAFTLGRVQQAKVA